MNASNAVENQKVSVCRLSGTNKELIVNALSIASQHAMNTANLDVRTPDGRHFIELSKTLKQLKKQIKESQEIWLIESK